jgi:hypothetical protein
MTYVPATDPLSTAAEWLEANAAVVDTVRQRTAVSGKAMPDAMLEDPTRLLDLVKETLVEAIRGDAPVGVVEDLLPALRVLSVGARVFDRNSHAATQLAALQGMRSRGELESALQDSAADAPDELSRASIDRLLAALDATPASDDHFTDPIFLGPDGEPPDGSGVSPGGTGTEPGGVDVGTDGARPDPGVTGEPGGEGGVGVGTNGGRSRTDLHSVVGGQIGGYLGGPEGAELGAQVGSEAAGEFNPLDGSNGAQFGAQVGSRIATQLCGEACAQKGAQIGGFIGGQIAGPGEGGSFQTLDQITDAVTCALCGPACIPCTLAAESMGSWVAPPVR